MAFTHRVRTVGSRQIEYAYCEASQLSTNTVTVLAGSELDARGCRNVSYTFSAATNGVTATIYAANKEDFSDEFLFNSGSVGAISVGTNEGWGGQASTATPSASVFSFYRVKFESTVDDAHGTLTVVGYAN